MNYENYGGTPLLGINSTVIVGHGISNNIAIKNMILLSKEVHEVGLTSKIQKALQKFSLNNKEYSCRHAKIESCHNRYSRLGA